MSDDITQTPEYKQLADLLIPYFGDRDKFESWMMSDNPMLGNVAPIDMLFLGRFEKLLKFVKAALEDDELWQRRN